MERNENFNFEPIKIAFNISDFVKQVSMLYGSILPYCNHITCPTMNAGRNYIYTWPEGKGRTISLPACQYIDRLMSWINVSSKMVDFS